MNALIITTWMNWKKKGVEHWSMHTLHGTVQKGIVSDLTKFIIWEYTRRSRSNLVTPPRSGYKGPPLLAGFYCTIQPFCVFYIHFDREGFSQSQREYISELNWTQSGFEVFNALTCYGKAQAGLTSKLSILCSFFLVWDRKEVLGLWAHFNLICHQEELTALALSLAPQQHTYNHLVCKTYYSYLLLCVSELISYQDEKPFLVCFFPLLPLQQYSSSSSPYHHVLLVNYIHNKTEKNTQAIKQTGLWMDTLPQKQNHTHTYRKALTHKRKI